MNLDRLLTERYIARMLETPRGQAHILSQIAEAEDNGEARVFDDALLLVDDPKLAKMIERHREDELRHGRLFRECMARTGVDPGPVPVELRAIDRVAEALGGFFDRPLEGPRDVMTAYLVLQVLEERALEQFPMYARAFRGIDAQTARTFEEVAADEERHLRYCHAISRRYAPSEEVLTSELARLRVLEARAFKATQQANMRYVAQHDVMPPGLVRSMWQLLGAFAARLDRIPLTTFARDAGLRPVAAAA